MKQTPRLTKAIKIVGIVAICIAFSFLCTQLMMTGMTRSNMLMRLATGDTLVGIITDKIETRGTYRLIIDVESYDSLDYPCTEEQYKIYNVGDTITVSVGILIV